MFIEPLKELNADLLGEDRLYKSDIPPFDNAIEVLNLYEGLPNNETTTLGTGLFHAMEDITFSNIDDGMHAAD